MKVTDREKDLLNAHRAKKAISQVKEAVLNIGNYENLVASNLLTQNGLIKTIELVGEYVYKMSHRIKNDIPDIPWAKIEGTRHFLVHEYHNVELIDIWKTANENIPNIEGYIDIIIEHLKSKIENRNIQDIQ